MPIREWKKDAQELEDDIIENKFYGIRSTSKSKIEELFQTDDEDFNELEKVIEASSIKESLIENNLSTNKNVKENKLNFHISNLNFRENKGKL